jgi:hypothetical protein
VDSSNPSFWDKLILNLPGSPTFDPTGPKVMKWDSRHGWIAVDVIVFVDDWRVLGATIELTWAVSRMVASRIQYLGIQEASKKRPPTQTPGAWAGVLFRASATGVSVTVAQEKWDKVKFRIGVLWDVLEKNNVTCEVRDLKHIMMDC